MNWKYMTLRLPPAMHQAANRAAAGRDMVLSVWIRQAIAEKIARDKQEARHDDVSGARRAAAATAKR